MPDVPVRLTPEALEDLTDAWGWHESQREGLGDEFRACVEVALTEISRTPPRWPEVRGDIRRSLTRRFPYAILYLAEADHVEVLAVFHTARNPVSWHTRR